MYVVTCLFVFPSPRVFRVGFMRYLCYVLDFCFRPSPQAFSSGLLREMFCSSSWVLCQPPSEVYGSCVCLLWLFTVVPAPEYFRVGFVRGIFWLLGKYGYARRKKMRNIWFYSIFWIVDYRPTHKKILVPLGTLEGKERVWNLQSSDIWAYCIVRL